MNDRGGHAAGDVTLQNVARIARQAVRAENLVARFGGDEFVIFLVDCVSESVVAGICEHISSGIEFMRPIGTGSDVRIGTSIGRAPLEADGSWAEALRLSDADAYRIKAEHHAFTRARLLRPAR